MKKTTLRNYLLYKPLPQYSTPPLNPVMTLIRQAFPNRLPKFLHTDYATLEQRVVASYGIAPGTRRSV